MKMLHYFHKIKEVGLIKEIKLAFGLRKGKIVHIDELTESERGLSCGCFCPSCGAPLQARLGQKNRHHFSHNSENCSNETATQTALHMLAKEIISQRGTLLFPKICHEYKNSVYFSYEYANKLPNNIPIKPQRVVKCDKILLEKKLPSIVPDIIFVSGENSCIIEIAVTHFVDEIKEQKIKKLGLPALEIDLSECYKQNLNRAEIENEIINNSENRRWIYYPNLENLICQAELKYKKAIDEIECKKKEAEKERKKQEELIQIRRKKYYKNKLKTYRCDNKTNDVIKELHFSNSLKEGALPFFLDIPISGEIIFKCDRRIWQSALFDKFIYHRNNSNGSTVSINKVNRWITKHQNLFKIDWNAIDNDFGDTYHIITQYLTYLHFLGFTSELYYQEAKLLQTHTLIPPKQENYHILHSAISSIDFYSLKPDTEIEKYLKDNHNVFLSNYKKIRYREDYPHSCF